MVQGAGLSVNPQTGDLAYCAGGVVVVYDPKKNRQSQFFLSDSSESKTSMACVAFSHDGKYLAAGEIGRSPSVLVWDLKTGRQVADMKAHKFGSYSDIRGEIGNVSVSVSVC